MSLPRITATELADLLSSPTGDPLNVTASIGIARMRAEDVSRRDLIAAADAALYEAKRRGKDCVAWVDLDDSSAPIDDRIVMSSGRSSAVLRGQATRYDASRSQQRDDDDAEVQLYRRFVDVLDRDFTRHHDTGRYADELRVPPAAHLRALSHMTGRGTEELITDRRMLEAARLLRLSDLSVSEIAHRAGFGDQMYFSRAFKRHHGEAPMAYRERLRAVPAPSSSD